MPNCRHEQLCLSKIIEFSLGTDNFCALDSDDVMSHQPTVFGLATSAGSKSASYATVIQIYLDESGTHKGSPVVTCAAYVGTVAAWDDWAIKWEEAKRPIDIVHATDCEAMHGEFASFTIEQRNEFASRILPVIAQADITPFAVGVRLHDYERVAQEHPELGFMIGETPYIACLQWTLMTALNSIRGKRSNEHIAVVHESNQYQEECGRTVDLLKERYPDLDFLLTFAEKKLIAQLQAADALAYEANKRFRNLKAADRRSLQALIPKAKRKPETLQYFDERTMRRWVERHAVKITLPESGD